MGIAGSATATVIANVVALVGIIAWVYVRDLPIRLRGPELRYLIPDRTILKTMIVKGFPMGLQMIVVSSAGLATLGLVNREGVETTAAFGVAMQLWTYLQMPAMALAAAASTMAAQNIGAGKWDRVNAITRAGIFYNLIITGILVLLLAVFDRAALALFLGGHSPALPIAEHIQLLATWSFILFGATMIIFGTMRANGAVMGPLIILFISLYPVRLGFALGGYGWLGADAIWLSFTVGSLANLGLAIAFYLHGGWRKARMMTPPPRAELEEEAQADGEPGGRIAPTA
jgi:Na+-driven multidrug efflux pump